MNHIKENIFFYIIFFPMLAWDCGNALSGAIQDDLMLTLKGVRGIGFQILILMVYLWLTGQLFEKKD